MSTTIAPGSTRQLSAILIIEDVDHKFNDVRAVIERLVGHAQVVRAKSLVEAEDALSERDWGLVVVDISMDIAAVRGARVREAHANLGGMDIIEQMYLLEKEAPTVIVTGFDYFVRAGSDADAREAQTFSDLEQQARAWIGDKLLGCVRYGVTGWELQLQRSLRGLVP